MSSGAIYNLFREKLNKPKTEIDPAIKPALIKFNTFLQQFKQSASPRVLDVCCFRGLEAAFLKREFLQSVTIVGVDLVCEAVQEAKKKGRIDEGYAANLATDDASLPFDEVDFAYCLRSGPAFDNKEVRKMLGHVKSKLRRGGRFFYQDLVRNGDRYDKSIAEIVADQQKPAVRAIRTKQQLLEAFHEAGFETTKTEITEPQHDQFYTTGIFFLKKPM